MITVSIESSYDVLSMSITHDECFELVECNDVLDKIQKIYRTYMFARDDKEIRFNINNHWIETRTDRHSVYVYYHSSDNMFERICSRYEIEFRDDDSIYLNCFNGDRLVSTNKII